MFNYQLKKTTPYVEPRAKKGIEQMLSQSQKYGVEYDAFLLGKPRDDSFIITDVVLPTDIFKKILVKTSDQDYIIGNAIEKKTRKKNHSHIYSLHEIKHTDLSAITKKIPSKNLIGYIHTHPEDKPVLSHVLSQEDLDLGFRLKQLSTYSKFVLGLLQKDMYFFKI